MTFQQLASAIAKKEGKKSQARIGDIREILKLLVETDVEYLVSNGGAIGKGPLDLLVEKSHAKYNKHQTKMRAR